MRKIIFLAAMFLTISAPALAETLTLATTTSTQDTGLLDKMAQLFKKDTGIDLKWVAVGTGKALELGKNCDADVLLTHAPKAEEEYVAAGYAIGRDQIMYNDFVLVGPAADPAGVKDKSAAEALATIANKGAVFVSRGDDSGTHKAEQGLWKASKLPIPDGKTWYVQAGQGMMATLVMAFEKNAYTLTDRGTYIKYEAQNKGKPALVILVEGDVSLRNVYAAMMVNPEKCPKVKQEAAKKFLAWWRTPAAKQLIETFTLEGKPLFFALPAK